MTIAKHSPALQDGFTRQGSTFSGRRWLAAGTLAVSLLGGCKTPTAPSTPDPEILSPNESGWWRDDVFYEVFVRSFADSNGDGKGDLPGLISKLDYLNDGNPATTSDLGVDALWLMPIYPSPSYHGYDVTDYRAVNPDYGTLADFDALISAAHARGMKVILDLELNHSSSAHPWFVSAKADKNSPYRDYYVWRDTHPTGYVNPTGSGDPWHGTNTGYYYGLFWGGMPDLNWKNPAVEAELLETMKFWLSHGADGFRVDAARYLVESDDGKTLADAPETHEVIQRLRHAIHLEYPEALLVAEAWTSSAKVGTYYGEGNEYQLAFAFELADGIVKSAKSGSRVDVNQANYQAKSADPDRGFEAPFLRNHDQVRVMRELSANPSAPEVAKAKLAFALLVAQPGTPFVYYGEELGMVGAASRDEDKRTPMRWTPAAPQYGFTTGATNWYGTTSEAAGTDVQSEQADPNSLWSFYRRLISMRHGSAALSTGDSARPDVTGAGDAVFAMLRTAPSGERAILVINLSPQPVGAFTVAVSGNPTVLEAEGLASPPTSQDGALAFTGLAAQSFCFLRLD